MPRTSKPNGDIGQHLDPWDLVWGQPYIDSARLAAAIDQDLERNPAPDFRTRLLVRDAARALKAFWGPHRFARWLTQSRVRNAIRGILKEELGKSGFHAIRRRLVASPNLALLQQVFELLGRKLQGRLEINIAGSIPTLVKGLTARPTDDIDIVDEVPSEIRSQRAVLETIKTKYGLTLGHVQSHYLPANWKNRRHFLGDFGGLRVYLVDEYDVFVSKLSSNQERHKDDLGVMARKLDKSKIEKRLLQDGKQFLESPHDRPKILANWAFLFREPLLPASEMARRKRPKKG